MQAAVSGLVSAGLVGRRRAEHAYGLSPFRRTFGNYDRSLSGWHLARSRTSEKRDREILRRARAMNTRTMGTYELEGLLGEGGSGQVYAAQDKVLGRPGAIKLLPAA